LLTSLLTRRCRSVGERSCELAVATALATGACAVPASNAQTTSSAGKLKINVLRRCLAGWCVGD
jgi:hypothetical protein